MGPPRPTRGPRRAHYCGRLGPLVGAFAPTCGRLRPHSWACLRPLWACLRPLGARSGPGWTHEASRLTWWPGCCSPRWACEEISRATSRRLSDAASLCAGALQRHLGRHSTSTSRRAPREPRSWHQNREAVVNAWSKPHLDPGDTRRSSIEHAAHAQLGAARLRACRERVH